MKGCPEFIAANRRKLRPCDRNSHVALSVVPLLLLLQVRLVLLEQAVESALIDFVVLCDLLGLGEITGDLWAVRIGNRSRGCP